LLAATVAALYDVAVIPEDTGQVMSEILTNHQETLPATHSGCQRSDKWQEERQSQINRSGSSWNHLRSLVWAIWCRWRGIFTCWGTPWQIYESGIALEIYWSKPVTNKNVAPDDPGKCRESRGSQSGAHTKHEPRVAKVLAEPIRLQISESNPLHDIRYGRRGCALGSIFLWEENAEVKDDEIEGEEHPSTCRMSKFSR